jgi:hypothetical protein
MHPWFATHNSDGKSSMTGKSMRFPLPRSIVHVRIHAGLGVGARFMKKNGPAAPFG